MAAVAGICALFLSGPPRAVSPEIMVVPGGDSVYLLGGGLGLAGLGTISYYVPAADGRGARAVSAFGHPVPDGTAGVRAVSREGRERGPAVDRLFLVQARSTGFERLGGLAYKRGEGLGAVMAHGLAMNQFGVWGAVTGRTPAAMRGAVPLARVGQVTLGPAVLLTNISGSEVRPCAIEIRELRRQYSPRAMGIVFRVTDPKLLSEAGGVALGLSGSPILQHGRLAGIVAYVDPSDPSIGYANYAQWDYETKFGSLRK